MKKLRLLTLLALVGMFVLFLLVGCKKIDHITSVSLKDHDPNHVIEMVRGNFDYSAYTVIVSYDSGNTREIALTEEMIVASFVVARYVDKYSVCDVNYGFGREI